MSLRQANEDYSRRMGKQRHMTREIFKLQKSPSPDPKHKYGKVLGRDGDGNIPDSQTSPTPNLSTAPEGHGVLPSFDKGEITSENLRRLRDAFFEEFPVTDAGDGAVDMLPSSDKDETTDESLLQLRYAFFKEFPVEDTEKAQVEYDDMLSGIGKDNDTSLFEESLGRPSDEDFEEFSEEDCVESIDIDEHGDKHNNNVMYDTDTKESLKRLENAFYEEFLPEEKCDDFMSSDSNLSGELSSESKDTWFDKVEHDTSEVASDIDIVKRKPRSVTIDGFTYVISNGGCEVYKNEALDETNRGSDEDEAIESLANDINEYKHPTTSKIKQLLRRHKKHELLTIFEFITEEEKEELEGFCMLLVLQCIDAIDFNDDKNVSMADQGKTHQARCKSYVTTRGSLLIKDNIDDHDNIFTDSNETKRNDIFVNNTTGNKAENDNVKGFVKDRDETFTKDEKENESLTSFVTRGGVMKLKQANVVGEEKRDFSNLSQNEAKKQKDIEYSDFVSNDRCIEPINLVIKKMSVSFEVDMSAPKSGKECIKRNTLDIGKAPKKRHCAKDNFKNQENTRGPNSYMKNVNNIIANNRVDPLVDHEAINSNKTSSDTTTQNSVKHQGDNLGLNGYVVNEETIKANDNVDSHVDYSERTSHQTISDMTTQDKKEKLANTWGIIEKDRKPNDKSENRKGDDVINSLLASGHDMKIKKKDVMQEETEDINSSLTSVDVEIINDIEEHKESSMGSNSHMSQEEDVITKDKDNSQERNGGDKIKHSKIDGHDDIVYMNNYETSVNYIIAHDKSHHQKNKKEITGNMNTDDNMEVNEDGIVYMNDYEKGVNYEMRKAKDKTEKESDIINSNLTDGDGSETKQKYIRYKNTCEAVEGDAIANDRKGLHEDVVYMNNYEKKVNYVVTKDKPLHGEGESDLDSSVRYTGGRITDDKDKTLEDSVAIITFPSGQHDITTENVVSQERSMEINILFTRLDTTKTKDNVNNQEDNIDLDICLTGANCKDTNDKVNKIDGNESVECLVTSGDEESEILESSSIIDHTTASNDSKANHFSSPSKELFTEDSTEDSKPTKLGHVNFSKCSPIERNIETMPLVTQTMNVTFNENMVVPNELDTSSEREEIKETIELKVKTCQTNKSPDVDRTQKRQLRKMQPNKGVPVSINSCNLKEVCDKRHEALYNENKDRKLTNDTRKLTISGHNSTLGTGRCKGKTEGARQNENSTTGNNKSNLGKRKRTSNKISTRGVCGRIQTTNRDEDQTLVKADRRGQKQESQRDADKYEIVVSMSTCTRDCKTFTVKPV